MVVEVSACVPCRPGRMPMDAPGMIRRSLSSPAMASFNCGRSLAAGGVAVIN